MKVTPYATGMAGEKVKNSTISSKTPNPEATSAAKTASGMVEKLPYDKKSCMPEGYSLSK